MELFRPLFCFDRCHIGAIGAMGGAIGDFSTHFIEKNYFSRDILIYFVKNTRFNLEQFSKKYNPFSFIFKILFIISFTKSILYLQPTAYSYN